MEGVLQRVIAGLNQDQDRRRENDLESAEKIDQFIKKVEHLLNLQEIFTLVGKICLLFKFFLLIHKSQC